MAELYLNGYLTGNPDGIISLTNKKFYANDSPCDSYGDSIITSIENFAKKGVIAVEHTKGLGGRLSYIDNVNLRIYFTNNKCKLEEAMLAMDNYFFGGNLNTRVIWLGYSEYTITELDLEKFTIGGHALNDILYSHIGEYCHIIIEV